MRSLRSVVSAALMSLSVLGAARGDGGATDAQSSAVVRRRDGPVWGTAVRGLQMGIALCPSRYCLDDDAVTLDILLRNVSDGPLSLVGHVDSPGTPFETRRGYPVQLAVLTRTGQPVPEPPLQKMEGPGFPAGTIAAGETVTVVRSESLRYFDLNGLVPGTLLLRATLMVRESNGGVGWHGALTAEAPFEVTLDRVAWGRPMGAVRAGILARQMEYGTEGRLTLVVENMTDRTVTVVSSNGWGVAARSRGGRASELVERLVGGVGLGDLPCEIGAGRVALAHHSVAMPTLGRWSADLGLGAGAVFRMEARMPCRIDDGATPRDAVLATETDVTITNSPWAPLPSPAPLSTAAEPWGDAVEGIQCRLVPHKAKWRAGELPTLELQIRNRSALDYSVVLAQQPHELSVDDCRYTWSAGWHFTSGSVQPGEEIRGILVSLVGQWRARVQTASPGRIELKSLSLGPGGHSVRLALDLRHGPAKGGKASRADGAKVVRVWSNPVPIEVLAE